MSNNKVIYRHLKPCGEVFYIGVGTIKRPYDKDSRSTYWYDIVNEYSYEVQILKKNLTLEEAYELEKILIKYYGRKDLGLGNLVNLTDGGGGFKVLSEESRKKIGDAQRGGKNSSAVKVIDLHTDILYGSMSEAAIACGETICNLSKKLNGDLTNNTTFQLYSDYLKGIEHQVERLVHQSKKVINVVTKEIYHSIKEAAKFNYMLEATLNGKLNGRIKNDTNLQLYSDYLKGIPHNKYENKIIKSRIIDTKNNEIYDTITEAAIKYNIDVDILRKKLTNELDNDTSLLYYAPYLLTLPKIKKERRGCIVLNTETNETYNSIKEAALINDIDKKQLTNMLGGYTINKTPFIVIKKRGE